VRHLGGEKEGERNNKKNSARGKMFSLIEKGLVPTRGWVNIRGKNPVLLRGKVGNTGEEGKGRGYQANLHVAEGKLSFSREGKKRGLNFLEGKRQDFRQSPQQSKGAQMGVSSF